MLYPEKDSSDDVETLVDSLTAEGAHLSGLGISNLSHSHIQQLTKLSQELQHTTMDTDEENEEEMTAEEITDEEEDDEDEHELDEEEEEDDDDEEENEHENGELIEEGQVEDHLMDTVENEVEIETEIQTDEQNRGAVESAENFLLDTVVKATSTATITMAESAVAITSSLASSLVTLTTTPAAAAMATTTSKQQQHNVSGGGGSALPPLRPLTIIAPKPQQQQQQQQQHNTSGGGSANTTTAALTKVPINMKPLQAGQQLLLVQGTGANQAIKLVSTSGGQELNLANFSFGGRLVSLKPATGGVAGSGNTVLKTLASNAQQNTGNSTNNAISLDQQQQHQHHHHQQPKPIMMKKLLTSASHQKLVMTSSSSGATAGKSTFSSGTATLATNKQGQIICLQKSALSTGGTGNNQQSQQAGPQQIKLLPASQQAALNAALASPTKTITLQQAQEMGLIATKVMPQSSQLAAPGGGIQHQKQHTLLINKPGTKTIKIVPQVSGMATGTTQQLIATTASGQKIHLSQLKTQSKLLPISSGAITGTIGTASSQVTSNIGGGGTSGTAAATFITTSAAGGSNNNKIPTQRLIFKTTTATVANSNNNNINNNNNGSSAGGINTSSASGGGGSGAQNNNNNNINNNNSSAVGTTTTAVLPSGQILQLSNAQALGSGQLHQINIPGKGVQLIKFVQAPNPDTSSSGLTSNKSSIQTTLATPGGNIVLTEVKAGTTLTSKPLKTIAAKTSTISTPITPTNTIITPGGQVVMLPAYATAKVAIPTIRHHHSTPTKHHNHNQNQQQSQQQAVAAQKTKEQQELLQQQKNGGNNVVGGGNQMTSEAIMMQSHLVSTDASSVDANGMRPRKPCNCTKSQCLKLYCDCFANGEFCYMCNCMNCYNNLEYEDHRQRAIKTCLERNPHAFKPKIGKAKDNTGDTAIRKHTKGCNCKRSGCLKNYCECYEAKIACSNNCKCIGCRNIEDSLGSDKRSSSCSAGGIIGNSMGGIGGLRMMTSFEETMLYRQSTNHMHHHNPNIITTGGANKQLLSPSNKDGVGGNGGLGLFRTRRTLNSKQAINFITDDVIEATSQCMLSILDNSESNHQDEESTTAQIIQEFGSCMAEIIAYSTRHTHNNNNSNDHNK